MQFAFQHVRIYMDIFVQCAIFFQNHGHPLMACIDSVERALSISTKADISRLQNTIENTKAALQDSQSDVIRLRGKTGSVVEDARTRVAALGVIFMGCQMNIYYYSSTWHKIIITWEVNRYNNGISPNVKRKIIAKKWKVSGRQDLGRDRGIPKRGLSFTWKAARQLTRKNKKLTRKKDSTPPGLGVSQYKDAILQV